MEAQIVTVMDVNGMRHHTVINTASQEPGIQLTSKLLPTVAPVEGERQTLERLTMARLRAPPMESLRNARTQTMAQLTFTIMTVRLILTM